MKKIYSIILGLTIGVSAIAQDYHFSQFYGSPLTLNPGFTGAINGNLRVGGIYRNQWGWAKVLDGGYGFRTMGAYFDLNILRGKLPADDYVGLGGYVYSDKAGDAGFGPMEISGFVAYHKSLGNSRNPQYLSIGVQGTYIEWSLDPSKLYFDDQYDANVWNGKYSSLAPLSSADHSNLVNKANGFDVSSGLLWYASPSDVLTSVYAGVALAHIIRPTIQLLTTGGGAQLYGKITGHVGGEVKFNDELAVVPALIYLKQGPASEFNVGTSVKFILGEVGDFEAAWSIGPWYRIVGKYNGGIASDAVIAATRFDFGRISVGFSYDMLVSSLRKAESTESFGDVQKIGQKAGIKGGPELFFSAEFPIQGKTSSGAIVCPRF